MRDPIPRNGGGGGHNFDHGMNGKNRTGHRKSDYCWSFNRGEECKFGQSCQFIERCSYCDSPAHPRLRCPKLKKKDKNSPAKNNK